MYSRNYPAFTRENFISSTIAIQERNGTISAENFATVRFLRTGYPEPCVPPSEANRLQANEKARCWLEKTDQHEQIYSASLRNSDRSNIAPLPTNPTTAPTGRQLPAPFRTAMRQLLCPLQHDPSYLVVMLHMADADGGFLLAPDSLSRFNLYNQTLARTASRRSTGTVDAFYLSGDLEPFRVMCAM